MNAAVTEYTEINQEKARVCENTKPGLFLILADIFIPNPCFVPAHARGWLFCRRPSVSA
jgi:hypothetical protein